MIFKTHVQRVSEEFLISAVKSYPHTLQALLSHPKLPQWYENVAQELTKQEAEASIKGEPFNADNAIRTWAAGYVAHALKPNKDKYTKQIQKEADIEANKQ